MKAPGTFAVESLFEGYPRSLALFQHIRRYIESLGSVKIEAAKTQVSFGMKRKFAWVWLPQMWIKKQPRDSIVLTFSLPRRVEDPRIKQAVEPRPGRWTHHVVIQKEADLDDQVKQWLKEAYSQAG
jgi:adenylate kinase family enzyme